jgi:hypothetical protein
MARVLKEQTSGRQKARIDGIGKYAWEEEEGGGGGGGGGGAQAGTDQYPATIVQGVAHFSGAISHSDVPIDGMDDQTFTLDNGTADGFVKTLRGVDGPGGHSRVEGAFRTRAGANAQPVAIVFGTENQFAVLRWQAATSKWIICGLFGATEALS